MATPTVIRASKDVVCAVAHQTAYGTPAATSAVLKLQVLSFEVTPGFGYEHPRGTTGSAYPKTTHVKTHEMPKAELEVLASPKTAAFILEYATGGRPRATLADGDLSEANDTGNALSAWVLDGVRPGFNTDASNKLYPSLLDETPGAGQATVNVYKDNARTQLVASGSAANNNPITLAEQGSSGLSGTVALTAPAASDVDIELTITKVRPQMSGELARFFTLWRDHGSGKLLERISDCAITKFTRLSAERGLVRFKLEVVGSTYFYDNAAGGTFVPGLVAADKEYYAHGTVTLRSDVDGANVAQHVRKLDVGIENDVEVVLANAETASAIWKRAVTAFPIEWSQRLCAEAQAIALRGLEDTIESVKITDAYASRTCEYLFDQVKSVEPSLPKFGEDGFDEIEHKMQGFEEVAGSPTTPLAIVLAL